MTMRLTTSGFDLSGLLPGEVLQEVLQEHHITRIDLAAQLEIPLERVNSLIAGKEPITEDIALQLAQLFDRSVRFFQR